MSVVTLYFSIRFYLKVTKTENKVPRWLLQAMGYLPFSVVFVLSVFTDSLISGGYVEGAWLRPIKGYGYYYYNVYMLLMTLAGILLLYLGKKRAKTAEEIEKFRNMLYLAAASMLAGFLTAAEAGLISHLKHGEIPELGLIASLFWSWSFRIVMVKHNFFPYQLQIYEMLHMHSTFGIVITDASGMIVEANPAARHMLNDVNIKPKENRITDLFPDSIREQRLQEYQLRFERRELVKQQEIELQTKNGDIRIVTWDNGFLDFDDQQLQVYIARDITEQRANEKKVAFLAYHDPLTGLANRILIYDRMAQAVRLLREGKLSMFAVLLIDLDDFKRINDHLGHQAGDELLKQVAERLQDAVTDQDTVARLGGDEFIVLLTSADSEEAIRGVADRIIHSFRTVPVKFPAEEVYISSSIGISCCPRDGQEIDTLLRAADIAMYQSKGSGKQRYELFAEGMRLRQDS
ncbi:sensor domain-containing diguanylate cyclase [Paenibacillus silviterrae]|uniref:sensor domain-containing diguanylate cyclase n=1 Tax=Paenibacillus silviterrae TaxID=3242194 RepID=UPI002542DC1D|nr:sensor domain-containing diguanylate cyclase [Paenibacillus chinjuensis]